MYVTRAAPGPTGATRKRELLVAGNRYGGNLLLGWLARVQGTVRIHCALVSARLFALWDAWKNKDTAAHNAVVADEIACVSSGDAVVGTMFIADPFERDCWAATTVLSPRTAIISRRSTPLLT
jgi:hypothetical protein